MHLDFLNPLGVVVLGIGMGLQHALEPDHLAAVSTLVATEKSFLRAVRLGLSWGLGHLCTLCLAGILVILIKVPFTPAVERVLECLLGCVMMWLGVRALRLAFELMRPDRIGCDCAVPAGHWCAQRRRSFLVGCLHGLAGSGSLLVLVVSTLPGTWWPLLYLAVFGFGAQLGMGCMSVFVGLPFRWAEKKNALLVGMRMVAGCASLGMGAFILSHIVA